MDPKELRRDVAANIRELAEERRLPLSKLADFSGIARPAFWRALAGDSAFTTDRICKLANTLEVVPARLLERRKPAE